MATAKEQYKYYSDMCSNIEGKITRIEKAQKNYKTLREGGFADNIKKINDFYKNLNAVGGCKDWEGKRVRDTKGYYKDNVCKYANKQEEVHDLMIKEFSNKLSDLKKELSTAEKNKSYWNTQVNNENNK